MDAAVPDFHVLGPDPEPVRQRFDQVLGPPRTCPIAEAFGESAGCSPACPFFCVPGARYACAVEQWSPRARRNRNIAAWFRQVKVRVGSDG